MKSPDPFKKELHPDAQVWKEEHDKLIEKTKQQQEIIRILRAVLGEAYRERKEIYETDKVTINWFDLKKPSWLMLAKTILKELE